MTLTELFHDADPGRDLSAQTPEQSDAAITALLDADSAPASTEPQILVRRRRLSPGHRAGLALVAASAAVGLAVVPAITSHHGTASAAAVEVLRAAAIHATDPPARPEQWWRIESKGTELVRNGDDKSEHDELIKTSRVQYVAVDGSRPTWYDDVQAKERSVWTTNLTPNQMPGMWEEPNPAWLAGLPRDAGALRSRLYHDASGHGQSHDGEVYVLVTDLLRTGMVPADLRSSLFTVLESVPGVDVVDASVVAGQSRGVALGYTERSGALGQIVVDPSTGQVVAEREGTTGLSGEQLITRTVVDQIPADVQKRAKHQTCTLGEGGSITCTN